MWMQMMRQTQMLRVSKRVMGSGPHCRGKLLWHTCADYVIKPRPEPPALASKIPGQAKAVLRPWVWPSLAQPNLAWLGPACGLKPGQAHHYLQHSLHATLHYHSPYALVPHLHLHASHCSAPPHTITYYMSLPTHYCHVNTRNFSI